MDFAMFRGFYGFFTVSTVFIQIPKRFAYGIFYILRILHEIKQKPIGSHCSWMKSPTTGRKSFHGDSTAIPQRFHGDSTAQVLEQCAVRRAVS